MKLTSKLPYPPEPGRKKTPWHLALAASLGLLSMASTQPLQAAGDYPTSKVNTTGLAVTDDTVTVGQLHSA